MANNTDIVAKVIASSILLNEERQLLRARDGTAPVTNQKPPAANVPAALANDSKAVAAVLLTLLDERIQASADDGAAQRVGYPSAPADIVDDGRQSSALLSARYAESGALALPDPRRTDIGAQIAPTLIANPQLSAAPELQSFMQRLAAAAARKSDAAAPAPGWATSFSRLGSGMGPMLVAGAAAAFVIWLGVIVAGLLFA